MKILYLFTREKDETVNAFVKGQEKAHQVTVLDLQNNEDFEAIVNEIDKADRIVCW